MKKLGSILIALAMAGCGDEASVKLSGAGESCTRRADCDNGLSCFAGMCVSTADAGTEDGGTAIYTPPTAQLGARGETCTATSDCEKGLICAPEGSGSAAYSLGRCDLANFGLTPTGKDCWAECAVDNDCFQLPIGSTATDAAGTAVAINSCADLTKILGSAAGACEQSGNYTASTSKACFLYKTYCDIAAGVWACNNGTCSYVKTCTIITTQAAAIEAPKGCPSLTRASYPTPTNLCNTTTSKCEPDAAKPKCANAGECLGKAMDTGETCVDGECVCVSAECYRKCNDELDCAAGYTCDTAKQVCQYVGECDNDIVCKGPTMVGTITAKCVDHKCVDPCKTDLDCNPSGLGALDGYTFESKVCVSGNCVKLGCNTNADCSRSVNGTQVKMFCATLPATTATVTYHSAITY